MPECREQIWMQIRRLQHSLHEITRRREVVPPAAALLIRLSELEAPGEGVVMKQLARELCVTKASVSQLAGMLEKDGLLTRSTNPHNRRYVYIGLTPQGREAARREQAFYGKLADDVFAQLSEEERAMVDAIIKHAAQIMEEKAAQGRTEE